ncbi:hypothetical protein BH10ACI1_BH10ACI1_24930 [soil metagenome]
MSFEDYQVFQCPNCQQFISTRNNSCRFCSLPLTNEIKLQGIEVAAENNRKFRFKNSKIWFYSGIGVFGLGILLLAFSILSVNAGEGRLFIWSPIITLIGLGQMINGIIGMRDERKKNKNV